jgi:predicted ferric reductase
MFWHIPTKSVGTSPMLYLVISACLAAAGLAARIIFILYRNEASFLWASIGRVVFTADFNGKEIDMCVTDAVYIKVKPKRLWTCRPGQYIHVCILDLTVDFPPRFRPFYVAQWEGDTAVLICQGSKGLAQKLHPKIDTDVRALIEGPYGKSLVLDRYQNALFVATDIGVAGVLSFIEQLVQKTCREVPEAKTKSIVVHWEMASERECHFGSYYHLSD